MPPSAPSLPPPPPTDRIVRRHLRFDLLAQVEVRGEDEVLVLAVRNLSAGGMFLELDKDRAPRLRAGSILDVYMDLGLESGRPLRLETQAKVVHRTKGGATGPGGIGVTWSSCEPEVALQVAHILLVLQASPAAEQ